MNNERAFRRCDVTAGVASLWSDKCSTVTRYLCTDPRMNVTIPARGLAFIFILTFLGSKLSYI